MLIWSKHTVEFRAPRSISLVVPGGRHPADCFVLNPDSASFIPRKPKCPTNIHSTRRQDFPVAGPRRWNSLPASLRQPDTEFGQFKRLLKTLLYSETAAH